MAENEKLQFIYQFDPIRPELVTDADAWTDEDNRIAEAHFAYLQKQLGKGSSCLRGAARMGLDRRS